MRFVKRSLIGASAEDVFAFHESPRSFERLQPPWQQSEVIQAPPALSVGSMAIVIVAVGPVRQAVVTEHVAYEHPRMFADRLVAGPFKSWVHEHIIEPVTEDSCTLTDDVEYDLPLGAVGKLFGGWYAQSNLDRLFEYRHTVTRQFCEGRLKPTHDQPPRDQPTPQVIGSAIAGAFWSPLAG